MPLSGKLLSGLCIHHIPQQEKLIVEMLNGFPQRTSTRYNLSIVSLPSDCLFPSLFFHIHLLSPAVVFLIENITTI